MTTLVFVPPTEKVYLYEGHPLLRRVPLNLGITVFKEDGIYREVRGDVLPEEIDSADVTYLGGHEYEITEEEATELIAAGYGIYITYSGYGSGYYGMGHYGIPQEGT